MDYLYHNLISLFEIILISVFESIKLVKFQRARFLKGMRGDRGLPGPSGEAGHLGNFHFHFHFHLLSNKNFLVLTTNTIIKYVIPRNPLGFKNCSLKFTVKHSRSTRWNWTPGSFRSCWSQRNTRTRRTSRTQGNAGMFKPLFVPFQS